MSNEGRKGRFFAFQGLEELGQGFVVTKNRKKNCFAGAIHRRFSIE